MANIAFQFMRCNPFSSKKKKELGGEKKKSTHWDGESTRVKAGGWSGGWVGGASATLVLGRDTGRGCEVGTLHAQKLLLTVNHGASNKKKRFPHRFV